MGFLDRLTNALNDATGAGAQQREWAAHLEAQRAAGNTDHAHPLPHAGTSDDTASLPRFDDAQAAARLQGSAPRGQATILERTDDPAPRPGCPTHVLVLEVRLPDRGPYRVRVGALFDRSGPGPYTAGSTWPVLVDPAEQGRVVLAS